MPGATGSKFLASGPDTFTEGAMEEFEGLGVKRVLGLKLKGSVLDRTGLCVHATPCVCVS